MEVLHTRECPILGTRSVRRTSGLLVTGYPEVIPQKCGSVRIGDDSPEIRYIKERREALGVAAALSGRPMHLLDKERGLGS